MGIHDNHCGCGHPPFPYHHCGIPLPPDPFEGAVLAYTENSPTRLMWDTPVRGEQGEKGQTGATGAQGPKGDTGSQGQMGRPPWAAG